MVQSVKISSERMVRNAWGRPCPRLEKAGAYSSSPGLGIQWRMIGWGGEGVSGPGLDPLGHPPGVRGLIYYTVAVYGRTATVTRSTPTIHTIQNYFHLLKAFNLIFVLFIPSWLSS